MLISWVPCVMDVSVVGGWHPSSYPILRMLCGEKAERNASICEYLPHMSVGASRLGPSYNGTIHTDEEMGSLDGITRLSMY